jgi:O-antigen/teichoic acid export membrane protein
MNFYRKLSSNEYTVSIISKVVLVMVNFLITIIYARYLGPELKGVTAYINNIVGIGSIVMGLGLHHAYPYYRKKYGMEFRNVYISNVSIIMVAYVLLVIIANMIIQNNIQFAIISSLLPIMTYTHLITYLLIVDHANKKNISELVISTIDFCFILILYNFTKSNLGIAIIIMMFKNVVMASYSSISLKIKFHVKEVKLGLIKELMRYGFFPMLSLIMTTLNYKIDVIMMKGIVSNEQIGIYSVGVGLAEKGWIIPEALRDILISKLAKGKDTDEVCLVIRLAMSFCTLMIIGLILVGKPFVQFFYGDAYTGSYMIAVLTILGVIGMIYFKMIATYNIVNKKQVINFILLCGSVTANVIGNLILIPMQGIRGAAIASVVSYSICGILFATYFCKVKRVRLNDIIVIKQSDIREFISFIRKSN